MVPDPRELTDEELDLGFAVACESYRDFADQLDGEHADFALSIIDALCDERLRRESVAE